MKQPILLITEPGREEEAVIRLSRVGYDSAIGYLKGGIDAWKNAGLAIDTLEEETAEEFANLYKQDKNILLLDTRKESEFNNSM